MIPVEIKQMGDFMDERIQSILKGINKRFGEEVAGIGKKYSFEKIPFSSPKMNYMTYGGLPVGKVIEFFGPENGGKSTTALDICANAQKKFAEEGKGRQVAYVDVENSLSPSWASTLGVDMDSLIVVSPTSPSAEKILDSLEELLKSEVIGLVVLDSIPAMLPDVSVEESLDKKTYGGISAVLTRFCSKTMPICAKYNCTLIAINQMRDNLNSPYGGTTTPGGKAWKYACSLRMKFQHGPFIDEDGKELTNSATNPFGNIVNVVIEKTKCCPPNRRQGHYTLRYNTGIDYISDMADLGLLYGTIVQSGAWFSIVDKETGELLNFEDKDLKFQGRAKMLSALKQNVKLYDFVSEKITNLMKED